MQVRTIVPKIFAIQHLNQEATPIMKFMFRSMKLLFVMISAVLLHPGNATAQHYTRTDLVTSATDPNLVNGWGLTRSGGSPFWVSDNATGKSTLYNGAGQGFPVGSPLVVTIPPAPGSTAIGTPTGTVFNITTANLTPSFSVSKGDASAPALFLFATLDGTISGWNPGLDPTNAVIAVNPSNEGAGAVYTGLAISSDPSGDFLYAADNGPNSPDDPTHVAGNQAFLAIGCQDFPSQVHTFGQLRAQIARLGKSSITTEIDVVRDQELLVAGRLRHVCVATDTWRKTDIPDWIRGGLRRFAGADGE